jgi:hypothetical protein
MVLGAFGGLLTERVAAALGSHTYSKNDLACAADFRVANAGPCAKSGCS